MIECRDRIYLKMLDIVQCIDYQITLEEVQDAFAERNSNELKGKYLQFGKRIFVEKKAFDEYYEARRVRLRNET